MRYSDLEHFGRSGPGAIRGPVGLVICENAFLVRETVDWLFARGARQVVAVGAVGDALSNEDAALSIPAEVNVAAARTAAIAAVLDRIRVGDWVLLCFNGEFAFFPHQETRRLADFADFKAAERRGAVTGYAIDLYSDALGRDEADFSLDDVYFDTAGWYGFERDGRLVDVYGGLGWRYEEYTPRDMFRINRPALFQVRPGVVVGDDLWLNDNDANAVSCPWHHNPTMALMSVRRARAMRGHPKFGQGVTTFMWPHSARFEWRSEQLVDNGLIEMGQWL